MLLSEGIVDTWCCLLWRSLGGLEWVGYLGASVGWNSGKNTPKSGLK